MTQLLISVKNMEEAMRAHIAGVDIIDLKDPSEGALGALDLVVTKQIVQQINAHSVVSATVGESHSSIQALITDIRSRADVGVDIVKIAVSDMFKRESFLDEIGQLTKTGIKLIAVFFADETLRMELLPAFKKAGFYGAMLDTKNKRKNLLQVRTQQALQLFTQRCCQFQLKSGLAGSLQPHHVDLLVQLNPTYIGFRGGVCENAQRESTLNDSKVSQVVNMLRDDNKNCSKARSILGLTLHS